MNIATFVDVIDAYPKPCRLVFYLTLEIVNINLAERQVRPFTALRKDIQHYESDAGAKMAAVYLSVVSTVKLASQLVWRFLVDFFEDI